MTAAAPSITEVLKDQLYLGNLSAALSVQQRERYRITHILSVCPDLPSSGRSHLNIAVEDSEYENLLIHLPRACSFIQDALDAGGRVLVHCVMGISRSTTVVAAFLMKTQNIPPVTAIRNIKKKRPQVHPNYGFIKQLTTFSKCNFEPSTAHPDYRSWKRRHEQDVTYFLNHMVDTVAIIPNKLLLSSDFPSDPVQAQSLLLDIGVTHLLSISPAEIASSATSVTHHHHININSHSSEALLLALPDIVAYIRTALKSGGLVLVHSLIESRACTGVCAYLMAAENHSPAGAFAKIEDALPLFNPTRNFLRNLELFQACGYMPKPSSAAIKQWLDSEKTNTSNASRDLRKTANSILSETSFDLEALGKTLSAIQSSTGSSGFISVR